MTPNVPNGGRSASFAEQRGSTLYNGERKVQLDLQHQVRIWPTPTVMNRPRTPETLAKCADFRKRNANQNTVPLYLEEVALMWPTPATRDFKGANSVEHVTTNGTGRMHMDQLPNFVEHAFRCSPPGPATPAGPKSSPERRTLNPLFVEWLMGWPIGWTGSAPVETASSHWWQAMRGELLRLGSRTPAQATLL